MINANNYYQDKSITECSIFNVSLSEKYQNNATYLSIIGKCQSLKCFARPSVPVNDKPAININTTASIVSSIALSPIPPLLFAISVITLIYAASIDTLIIFALSVFTSNGFIGLQPIFELKQNHCNKVTIIDSQKVLSIISSGNSVLKQITFQSNLSLTTIDSHHNNAVFKRSIIQLQNKDQN